MTQLVGQLMTRGPLAVDARMSIEAAAKVMRRHGVAEAFVTERGYLRGVLTLRDIAVWSIASDRHPGSVLAAECCNTDQASVPIDTTADEALAVMRRQGRQFLGVVDEGRLVGMVWISDVTAATRAAGALVGDGHAAGSATRGAVGDGRVRERKPAHDPRHGPARDVRQARGPEPSGPEPDA